MRLMTEPYREHVAPTQREKEEPRPGTSGQASEARTKRVDGGTASGRVHPVPYHGVEEALTCSG
jgi:hypothetical protein